MSGNFFSSGILSNNGEKLDKKDIANIMKLKIKNISIQIIPLHNNSQIKDIKSLGKIFHLFLHPMFTVTFSHIAIQITLEKIYLLLLNMENILLKKAMNPTFYLDFLVV